MTAAAPVTDAPAAMVKTCRREIPCDPVMTRRSCCERQSVSIANRFAWRRTNRAQTRRNGFCLRLIAARCGLDATRDTSARLYKIDHLSFSVRARSIAVEETGRTVEEVGTRRHSRFLGYTREDPFPLMADSVAKVFLHH